MFTSKINRKVEVKLFLRPLQAELAPSKKGSAKDYNFKICNVKYYEHINYAKYDEHRNFVKYDEHFY